MRHLRLMFSLLFLTGCAGFNRSCSNWFATAYGADWVVTQYTYGSTQCWVLRGVSVDNEGQSDGIHWLNNEGHMVHLAGWVDRVQVKGGNFAAAAKEIGVSDVTQCRGY